MISVKKYTDANYTEWNDFVMSHEDEIFTFHRDFIGYHGNRIKDHSFLFYQDKKLIGIIPAHISEKTLFSHSGLSFGGLCCDKSRKTSVIKELVATFKEYVRVNNFEKIVYTPVPIAYRSLLRYDDGYFIRNDSNTIVHQKLTFVLSLRNPMDLSGNRKRRLKKPTELVLKVNDDIDHFSLLLRKLLKAKYHSTPVHTDQELNYLSSTFKNHIKLYGAFYQEEMVGGILIFIYGQAVKIQYIASDKKGNELDAVTFLIHKIHQDYYQKKNYLDLGTAYLNENTLNDNLVSFKESFGARGMTFDSWELLL